MLAAPGWSVSCCCCSLELSNGLDSDPARRLLVVIPIYIEHLSLLSLSEHDINLLIKKNNELNTIIILVIKYINNLKPYIQFYNNKINNVNKKKTILSIIKLL